MAAPSKKVVRNRIVRLLKQKPMINPSKVRAPDYIVHEIKMSDVLTGKEIISEILVDMAAEGLVKLEYSGSNITSVELTKELELQTVVVKPTQARTRSTTRQTVPAVRATPQPRTPRKATQKETTMSTATIIHEAPTAAPALSPIQMIEQLSEKAEGLQMELAAMSTEVEALRTEKSRLETVLEERDADITRLSGALTTTSATLTESNTLNSSLKRDLEAAKVQSSSLDALALRVGNILKS